MDKRKDVRGGEAVVREAARTLERDRYLAALLSPRGARTDLIALAAFVGEVARIPTIGHEPAIGDIRLRWWRDALSLAPDAATGSPVADALRRAVRTRDLPVDALTGMLDAYAQTLEPGWLESPGALDAYAEATQGAAFRLAAQILGSDGTGPVFDAAARSYGRVQLLRALPALVTHGRNPFSDGAADWGATVKPILAEARLALAEARRLASTASATIRPALLPLALVEPYLAALEGLGSNVASERAEISPLSRVWRLYKASALGRL